MKEILFSYGALQKKETQLKLFGRLLIGSSDILIGYNIYSIEIMDQLFLSKGEQKIQLIAVRTNKKDHQIIGTAFELSEDELLSADKFEPAEYKRFLVELASGKKAWIYGETD